MTEKELLYVEDGINHETSIITILNETENCVKENDLKSLIKNQKLNHEKMKQKLEKLLEEKENEWKVLFRK